MLYLDVTDRCDNRCLTCDIWKHPDRRRLELSIEEIRDLLGQAVDLGCRIVSLGGGEPLTRPDLPDIVSAASALGLWVHMNSNGRLLTTDRVRRLRDSGLRMAVLSLDHPDREEHDAIRGVACYDRVMEGIRTLRREAQGIVVGLQCTLNRRNLKEARRIIDLAVALGVHRVQFTPIHTHLQQRDKSRESFGDLLFTVEDEPEIRRELGGLAAALRESGLAGTSDVFLDEIPTWLHRRPSFHCVAGSLMVNVDAFGRVSVCHNYDGPSTIRERRLKDILSSAAFANERRKVAGCRERCWDSGTAEPSIRCSARGWLRSPRTMVRDAVSFMA